MRFPRMTTRRWMILVVVGGTAFWTYRVRERQRLCSEAIDFHVALEECALTAAE
jgi:hypothetical protein